MFMTTPKRRVLSRLSSTRKSIAPSTAISRKRRLRSKSSWRKSTTRSAYILRLAIDRRWSSSSRFPALASEESHESDTQCEGQQEQHVPRCAANSPPDRRDGGENVGFPGGESFPPVPWESVWPAIFERANHRRCSSRAGKSAPKCASAPSSTDKSRQLLEG